MTTCIQSGEERINQLARKKRLGQFFSGAPVSKLLASLADSDSADSIIDPMCGSGDMLEACRDSKPSTSVGIEIDLDAKCNAEVRLGHSVRIFHGDCFK